MGIQGGPGGAHTRRRPPAPGPGRPPPTPFREWASKNRLKVVIAVVGGLTLNVANAWGIGLWRSSAPRDLPARAVVVIDAGENVCWSAGLGLGGRRERGCGDATYRMQPEPEERVVYADKRFFAEVRKTYRKRLRGRVAIALVVDGEIVDRASTEYQSAAVGY